MRFGSGFTGRPGPFTNGCFDLLHPGHVHYLERARKLGDLLIVALNSDESVRRLEKGPGRPVNPLPNRMAVLAGLECVDYVTSFGEDTPLETILLLRPKLVVKGGDWKTADIVGGKEAKEWGGHAKSLPFLKGYSTTSVLTKVSGSFGPRDQKTRRRKAKSRTPRA
jgi:rfaE bifunctional protein nucleotidyltransferase chain/domain